MCSNALKQQNSSKAYLKAGTKVSNSLKILQMEDGATFAAFSMLQGSPGGCCTKELRLQQPAGQGCKTYRNLNGWEQGLLLSLATPASKDRKGLVSNPSLTIQPQSRNSGTHKFSFFSKFFRLEELQPFVLKDPAFVFSKGPEQTSKENIKLLRQALG